MAAYPNRPLTNFICAEGMGNRSKTVALLFSESVSRHFDL